MKKMSKRTAFLRMIQRTVPLVIMLLLTGCGGWTPPPSGWA